MEIKKATSAADFEAIERLAAEIWREHYTPIIGEKQVEYMLDKFQTARAMQSQLKEAYEYFLAEEEGRLIGYVAFRQDDKELFLSKIYLLASYRGTGRGRQMMKFIEQEAKQRAVHGIRLTVNKNNSRSIEAYLKMGFEKVRPLVIDIGGGFVMDDYEMFKKIG